MNSCLQRSFLLFVNKTYGIKFLKSYKKSSSTRNNSSTMDSACTSTKILEALNKTYIEGNTKVFSFEFRCLCVKKGHQAEKIFYEAIIRSSGVSDFKYVTFQRNYFIDLVSDKSSVKTQHPCIMKKNFQKNFNEFLCFLFGDGNEAIIKCFPNLTKIVRIFLKSSWDSMRIMATFVGIKYLSGLLKLPHQIFNIPSLFSLKTDISSLKGCVIENGMRDISVTVNEVIVREFMLWSEQHTIWMMKSTMLDLVLKLLGSEFEKVKCFAFDTVKKLVKSNDLSQLEKKALKIEKAVLHNFSVENPFIFETATKILYKLVSNFGPLKTVDTSHLEKLLLCLSFNSSKVERIGSIVVIKTLKKDLNFHDFWHFLVVRLKVSEIEQLFKWYFFEEIGPEVLQNNLDSLKEIIRNDKYYCEGLESLKIALASNKGIKYWFNLLKTMTTSFQQSEIIKRLNELIEYSDKELEAVCFEIEEIFYNAKDIQICFAAFKALTAVEQRHLSIINGKISLLVENVFSRFICGEVNTGFQFSAISKSQSFNDSTYWDICVQMLKEGGTDDFQVYNEKVFYMMNFLFERTVAMYQKIESMIQLVATIQDPEKREKVHYDRVDLQIDLFWRVNDFEQLFSPALSPLSNHRLRFQACSFFIDLYTLFGPNTFDDPVRCSMYFHFVDDLIPNIVQTILVIPCSQPLACCATIKKFLNLLATQNVKLDCLKHFILNFQAFPHFDRITNFIMQYCRDYANIEEVAVIINDALNTLCAGDEGILKTEYLMNNIINVCTDFRILFQLLSSIKHTIYVNSRCGTPPRHKNIIETCWLTIQGLLT